MISAVVTGALVTHWQAQSVHAALAIVIEAVFKPSRAPVEQGAK